MTIRSDPSGPWGPHHWVVLGIVLVVGLISGWAGRWPDVLTGGDDLTLLFLSQSLQAGQYADLYLVGSPPHIQYPPMVPLWLLFLRMLFGEGLGVVQAGNLVLVALTALAAGDAVRRLTTPWFGVATVALISWNPSLQYYAGTMLSEVPYTALTVFAVWALLPREGTSPDRRWMIVGVVCTVAAFLARSVGIGVMAGVVAGLLVRRRWRWALAAAATSAVVAAAWFYHVRTTRTPGISLSYASVLTEFGRQDSAGTLLDRIVHHLTFYAMTAPAEVLGVPMVANTPIDNIALFLLLAGAGVLGIWATRRRWPEAALVALGTFGILCMWPFAIDRLAVPFAPLALVLAMIGIHQVGTWGHQGRRFRDVAGIVCAVLLAGAGITRSIQQASMVAACDRQDPYGAVSPCTTKVQRDVVLAARAARDRLPAAAVVATRWGQAVYHFGGFRTVPTGPIRRVAPDRAADFLRDHGATHVLLQVAFSLDAEVVAPRLLTTCDRLSVVDLGETAPSTLLLQLGDAARPDGNGCPALREFIAAAQR